MCPFGVVDRGVIMIQENSRIEAHGLAGSSSPQRGDTLPMTIFLHFFTCFFSGGGGGRAAQKYKISVVVMKFVLKYRLEFVKALGFGFDEFLHA